MTHRVLSRQLKKLGLTPDHPPPDAEAWRQLLARISQGYDAADQDRYLLERSLAISSKEMQQLHDDLRRRLTDELDRLRDVIDVLGAGLCVVGPEGTVRSVNPEGTHLLGYTEEELIGMPLADLLPPGHTVPLCSGGALALDHPHREEDGVLVCRDGTWLPTSYTLNPLGEGRDARGAVLVFFDIREHHEAEERLATSLSLLESTLESTADGILVADANGTIIDYNEKFLEMWHLTDAFVQQAAKGEVIAAVTDQLVDPEAFRARVRALYADPEAESFDVLHFKDGRIFERYSQPQRIGEAIVGRVWSFRDVTERQRAEAALHEQRAFLRQVIDINPHMIFAKDRAGRFLLVNEAVAEIYGTTVENLIGKTDADFNPHRDEVEAFRREDLAVIETGEERFIAEERITDAQGRIRWLQTIKRPMNDADDESGCVLGVATDITERKQAVEALERYARELEEAKTAVEAQAAQLARMVEQLEAAKRQAEESARLKANILDNVSHEVRTPIASILGYAQVLAEELGEEHREFVTYIRTNGRRLLQTLNSILDLSRIDTGHVAVEMMRVDLYEAAMSCATLCQPLVTGKPVALHVVSPPNPVYATLDATVLDRILQNLVTNAIKFTERGEVIIEIEGTREAAIVRVRDTGIGISETFMPHIFEEFEQESSGLARSHEGSGLGLSITQRLIRLMNGTITVESRKGAGSVFTVTFPVAAPTAQTRRLPNAL